MSEGLPEFLVQGELARLIPVCASSQRERAVCPVLLAALRVVHPFARDLLSEMGRRVGNGPRLRPIPKSSSKISPKKNVGRMD